ncbi:MAG: UDP-N-acetylglucosamine 1-carboxyvinyltransferase [Minisyncoccia bacterium]
MPKEQFAVEGLKGFRSLEGSIPVRGAKNAVLKALAASILFDDEVSLQNVPNIEDVSRAGELLQYGGATITRDKAAGTMRVRPPGAWKPELDPKVGGKLRASIVLVGPLLSRVHEARFPFPGGCVLGERPIDLFLEGFKAMGCEVEEPNGDDVFSIRAPHGLKGARIFFPLVSVGATETLMLAAVLAYGETVLQNCAMEPEIVALAEFLNVCGADISGMGTPTMRIVGRAGVPLRAGRKTFGTPPDRIEAGSFIILGALAGKEVRVENCEPTRLGALLALLSRAGVPLEVGDTSVTVRGKKSYASVSVRTHEYPGFPTDLQAPMAVFLTQAEGEATLLETVFDGRFRYVDDLVRMGADITVMNPHRILLRGPKPLERKDLESPDIRGGLAYLIAASVAEGRSTVRNAYLIDRGYERIEERLKNIGLNIKRETV